MVEISKGNGINTPTSATPSGGSMIANPFYQENSVG